jgi:hypothetical protein
LNAFKFITAGNFVFSRIYFLHLEVSENSGLADHGHLPIWMWYRFFFARGPK